ncbi:YdcH family protein [Sphingomonas flavalba]|uniref:YdcH family protein n=1 Tax=Sphingomonas flavalba TaxID=2559804 RepID=UPI0039DFF48F
MEQAHLSALNVKHAGLDAKISKEMKRPSPDQSLIARLKKQKLRIKEAIAGH